jgi:hypothetical protein
MAHAQRLTPNTAAAAAATTGDVQVMNPMSAPLDFAMDLLAVADQFLVEPLKKYVVHSPPFLDFHWVS